MVNVEKGEVDWRVMRLATHVYDTMELPMEVCCVLASLAYITTLPKGGYDEWSVIAVIGNRGGQALAREFTRVLSIAKQQRLETARYDTCMRYIDSWVWDSEMWKGYLN